MDVYANAIWEKTSDQCFTAPGTGFGKVASSSRTKISLFLPCRRRPHFLMQRELCLSNITTVDAYCGSPSFAGMSTMCLLKRPDNGNLPLPRSTTLPTFLGPPMKCARDKRPRVSGVEMWKIRACFPRSIFLKQASDGRPPMPS